MSFKPLTLFILFFAFLAFTIYSWEDAKEMPSSFSIPLNTSEEAQVKRGMLELEGALITQMIYDRDGSDGNFFPYYINPSLNSNIKGKIFTDTLTKDSDEANSFVTKSYIDTLNQANLVYKKGVNPECENGFPLLKKWDVLECKGEATNECPQGTSCKTQANWIEEATCLNTSKEDCSNYPLDCKAKTWSEVICVINSYGN